MVLRNISIDKKHILGLAVGFVFGFICFLFVNKTGSDFLIFSNPLIGAPYGALLGYLCVDIVNKFRHRNN